MILLGIQEWARVVILTISCSAISLSQLGMGRVYFHWERECRMLGRVGLCDDEVSCAREMV